MAETRRGGIQTVQPRCEGYEGVLAGTLRARALDDTGLFVRQGQRRSRLRRVLLVVYLACDRTTMESAKVLRAYAESRMVRIRRFKGLTATRIEHPSLIAVNSFYARLWCRSF